MLWFNKKKEKKDMDVSEYKNKIIENLAKIGVSKDKIDEFMGSIDDGSDKKSAESGAKPSTGAAEDAKTPGEGAKAPEANPNGTESDDSAGGQGAKAAATAPSGENDGPENQWKSDIENRIKDLGDTIKTQAQLNKSMSEILTKLGIQSESGNSPEIGVKPSPNSTDAKEDKTDDDYKKAQQRMGKTF